MVHDHIHSEEAAHVGEPDDADMADLAGIAPPCTECGKRERVDERGLCTECLDEGSESDE